MVINISGEAASKDSNGNASALPILIWEHNLAAASIFDAKKGLIHISIIGDSSIITETLDTTHGELI